jgi:DsbC/DsbD-like thiol-disulfide interchange protein
MLCYSGQCIPTQQKKKQTRVTETKQPETKKPKRPLKRIGIFVSKPSEEQKARGNLSVRHKMEAKDVRVKKRKDHSKETNYLDGKKKKKKEKRPKPRKKEDKYGRRYKKKRKKKKQREEKEEKKKKR